MFPEKDNKIRKFNHSFLMTGGAGVKKVWEIFFQKLRLLLFSRFLSFTKLTNFIISWATVIIQTKYITYWMPLGLTKKILLKSVLGHCVWIFEWNWIAKLSSLISLNLGIGTPAEELDDTITTQTPAKPHIALLDSSDFKTSLFFYSYFEYTYFNSGLGN